MTTDRINVAVLGGSGYTAVELIKRDPDQTERSVREGLSGNLCRCTGYEGIVHAVLDAAKKSKRQQ